MRFLPADTEAVSQTHPATISSEDEGEVCLAQSGRFSLILRILAVLAEAPDVLHTSIAIAEELSESAVVVRRYFVLLQQNGLIEQRRGRNGGAKLKVTPQQIGVGDVYLAAEGDWLSLGEPSISTLFKRIRAESISAMNETSLAQILKHMHKQASTRSKAGLRSPSKFRTRRTIARSLRQRERSIGIDISAPHRGVWTDAELRC
jgi:DNA-binding IscR family transcriptional regulator